MTITLTVRIIIESYSDLLIAVQARELTQAQTILQNQIERFGSNIFKEGAMVVPGQISVSTESESVKLTSFTGTADIYKFSRRYIYWWHFWCSSDCRRYFYN